MGETLIGRYKLSPKIFGERPTATLRTANDLRTHQAVMLKFPAHPDEARQRERIKREARAYRLLNGIPGLPTFHSYEENEGHPMGPFFAMEFVTGETLLAQLTDKAFPESKVIAVGRALCKILTKVHARGIIHRDVSIYNVLLDDSQRVRLIDFGLALVPNEAGLYDAYDAGRVGTRTTRAPEVLASFPGDARSDIYSLGQLLYLMANGTKKKAVHHMPGLSPEAVSLVSKELSAVIACCTHDDPEDRYQSVSELDKALAEITKQDAQPTTPQPRATSPWFGALLLVGMLSPFVVSNLSRKTSATQYLPASSPAPSTAPVVASANERTESTTQPSTLSAAKEESTPTTKAPKKTKQAPKEEEYEISPELIEFATKPIPIAKPQPIELRVELKEAK